jgi:hypothetical protein
MPPKVTLEPAVGAALLPNEKVAFSGVGGLAFSGVLAIVTLELLDPLLEVMTPTALGPFRSTLQSLLIGLPFGFEVDFAAMAAARRELKSAGAGGVVDATAGWEWLRFNCCNW